MHSPLEAAVGTKGLSTLSSRETTDTFSFPKSHPSPFHLPRRILKEKESERNNRKRLRKISHWCHKEIFQGRLLMDMAESERTMDSIISGSIYGFCIIFKSKIISASVRFHYASKVSPKEIQEHRRNRMNRRIISPTNLPILNPEMNWSGP